MALAGEIRTVIDVGASDGRWTARYRSMLPEASFLLFEANPVHHRRLNRYAARAGVHVEHSAASDRVGEVNFLADPGNPLGGAASSVGFDRHNIKAPTKQIDEAVRERNLVGPFFLKLDTQGHEREILAGAKQVLEETSLLFIEAYGVDDPGRMAFDELCALLRERGFRTAGIADPVNRPSDGILWQMDLAFIRDSHPAFLDTNYH
ncbi:FkbM family methyltransferase [Nocardioides coralli]|nr:FkbM family methyltransferase [Nocardioides coralli]